ncbi:MAG: translocation/assembly module TamB domain-containing protein [Myxococcota bacterium]
MLRTWLRRAIGWSARILAVLVALALVLSAAIVFYSATDDFHARLLERVLPELDRRMNGDLSLARIEGSPFTSLRLYDARLAWHGEEIVHLPMATIALDWPALLAGRLRIARIALDSPRVVFREDAAQGWDGREALAPLVPLPDAARGPREASLPLVIERLSIARGTLRIEPRARPPIELEPIEARARIDFAEKRIELTSASLAPGASKLTGQGEIPFRGPWRVDVFVDSLDPRDVARVAPQLADGLASILPATGGRATVTGERERIDVLGQLEWPEARLVFEARGEPDPFATGGGQLDLRLEAQSLAAVWRDAPLAGRVEAKLTLAAGSGRYAVRLTPRDGGSLEAEGSLDLRDVPTTEANLHARAFDPARAWPARPEWKGAIGGEGKLRLRGRSRETLSAAIDFALAPSRVGPLALEAGRLEAKLEGGRVEPFALALESASGRVDLRGRLSLAPGRPVALDATLELDDLGPLLALARRSGGGALRGSIGFDGRLEAGRLEADLTAEDLRVERFTLERSRLAVDAHGAFAGPLDAELASARLEGAFGTWTLATPARLQATADSLAMHDARFTTGKAALTLDGRIARRGRQSLHVVGRGLPIVDWARLRSDIIPPDWLTAGTLDLELTLGGTAERPTVDLALAPRDLALAARPIERAGATLAYDGGRLAAKLSASTPPGLRLDAEAQLPFALAWSSSIVAKPTGPLDARIDGDAADLSLLAPLVEGRVSDLGGEAHGRIRLTGPLDALQPRGELTARGLTGRPHRSGVRVVDGELLVELAADRFFLRRATATAEGHEATARFRASGEGPLPRLLSRWTRAAAPPDEVTRADEDGYTTQIELDRWPLVDTRRNRLIASGVLTARGTFEAPRIEGHVEIIEGTLRPDLTFLASGPPPRDPTIELAPVQEGSAETTNENGASNGPNLLSSFDALALDVKLDVGRDLWIKHEQAEALLAGHVDARKRPGKDLSLEGRIEAQRGFADIQGRRFRLIEGSIELVGGGKIDPVLNVLGRHRTRDYTIDARLTGTASSPVLTLSSDPSLSQEDILAVLLFGRPTGELTSDQQTTLGERAAALASSVGLSAVGRSVASALHFDALGLQIDELSSQRASVGAYVGRNIFVALAQDFSGERGQELSIEYEFWPGWSLIGSTTSQGTNSAGLVWKLRY